MRLKRASAFLASMAATTLLVATAINVTQNSSFEYPATGDPAHAANWSLHPYWSGGYERAADATWDGGYVMKLSNPATGTALLRGGAQVVKFNPPTTKPLLIRAVVKGTAVQNASADSLGANLYAEITYADGSKFWGPPWQMYKNTGTFGWRNIGFNTGQLGIDKPIAEVMVVPTLGAVPGTAYFDAVLVEPFTPLAKAAISFVGDDGWKSQYDLMYPILKGFGFVGTIGVVTNYSLMSPPKIGYMGEPELRALKAAGWGIESHTESHRDLTKLDATSMKNEMWWSKKKLVDKGFGTKHLILPFGAYNGPVLEYAQWHYGSVRNVWPAPNPAGTFRLDTRTFELKNTTTFDQAKAWIDAAVRDRTWTQIMMHNVSESCPTDSTGTYCVNASLLRSIASYVASQNADVVTYDEGYKRATAMPAY